MPKILVAFFSATGRTKKLANILAEITGADIYEIKPALPYLSKDLDFNVRNSRSALEMKDSSSRPEIAGPNADISNYDTIFLGFPIWWYIPPRIIQTFLESYDFDDKKIILFATSGGSDLSKVLDEIWKSSPMTEFILGKVFKGRADKDSVEAWIKTLEIN